MLSLATALLAAPAWAADPEAAGSAQEGADRFVPSFAITSGFRAQPWEAAGESRICRDCSLSDPTAMPVAPQDPAVGDALDVTPYVSGSLELMTPELPLPGSPRLFIGGEISGSFGTDRKVGLEGDPSEVGSPLEAGAPANFGPEEATGQGSEVVAIYGGLVYAAHAGIVLPFEMLGRQFRLRPSVGWTRFEIDIEGRVVDAECAPKMGNNSGLCNTSSNPQAFLRGVNFTESRTGTFDGIGPGLELEMETGRLGPFGTSILVGAGAYKILGNTRVAFDTQVVSFSDPAGNDEYDASYGFKIDPWFYRMTLGVRFHWLGTSR